jgi:ribose 1,5-bisphosphokinase
VTPGSAGVFVCIVGPSGVGKDTLIAEARARLAGEPGFLFVRRLVTRPANAYEDHESLTAEEFAIGAEANAFALAWRAHDLAYAVPGSVVTAVEGGAVAICNLSRAVVDEARRVFPAVASVLVTASVETLIARLAARGRETRAAIAARLAREASASAHFVPDYTIVNDGSREAGGDRLVGIVTALRSQVSRTATPA